jgi:hypothetical protein
MKSLAILTLVALGTACAFMLFTDEVSAGRVPVNCTKKHLINRGEYFSWIAKTYGLTERRLFELNPRIKDPHAIMAGDWICVGTPADEESTSTMATTSHTRVKSGAIGLPKDGCTEAEYQSSHCDEYK